MAKYLITDQDLKPFHELVCHASDLPCNSLPQADYDSLVNRCKSLLSALAPLGTASAALTSSHLADTQRHARAIRGGRIVRQLSQGELAIAAGIDQPSLSRIENGTKAASPECLAAIMAALAQ